MNIGFQRRQPRKSILGTVHRRYSVQLESDPTPKTSKTDICESTFTINLMNLSQRSRKSTLGMRRRESTLISMGSPPKEVDEISYSPEINYSSPKAIKKPSPPKVDVSVSEKRFNELLSPKSELNDSFETNESILMANENEESILATTLIDNTIIEMNTHPEIDNTIVEKSSQPQADNVHSTNSCDTTITTSTNEDDSFTNDCLDLLNKMIEKNVQTVANFHKQIDDIRKQIDETNRQTQVIENMKHRLVKKFDLKHSPNEPSGSVCKTLNFQDGEMQNPQQNFKSPSRASPMIGEIRSTIKYLKTPRMSRNARPSVYLTPHSMSFTIKTQYEKLLE